MKISIGTNVQDGPWGGGNLFAINLANYLRLHNHKVIFDLNDDDIDIILLTEPRKTSESSAFTHIDVNNYLKYVNNKAIVIHRINECDERKNTDYVNEYLTNVNKSSDYTVFVSQWLKELFENYGISHLNKSVILAGADSEIFNNIKYEPWDRKSKLKIVTHHWGANWNKGFEIYNKIDTMINSPKWKNLIEFTYIGNLPKNYFFKNSTHVQPISGVELANELKKNHIYVTASLNEPSGNHHIEAAQCSLPILYIESGGIPEYCEGYGVSFDSKNFENRLTEIMENYNFYYNNMKSYPFNSDKMSEEYLDLFSKLLNNREYIIQTRNFELLETNKFYYYQLLKVFKMIKQKVFKYV